MKSSNQVTSSRAFPGHQKEKSLPILLTTRWKSYGREGEEEREEGEDKGDGMDEEDDGDEGEVSRKASEEGSSESLGDVHTRPFILLKMWTSNDFKPTMMANVIKNLQDRYHIPDHIPIHLPGKFEKCYLCKIMDIGMYDAMFAVGLRLPLTTPSVGQLSRAIRQSNCSQRLEDIHWG